MLSPLYIGTISGLRLRLFEAPPPVPAMPWPSFDDLAECLGLPRSLQRHYLRRLPDAVGMAAPRPVLTETGMVRTIPHRAAAGIIDAAIMAGACEPDALTPYQAIATAALAHMADSVPMSAWPAFYESVHQNTYFEPLPPEWRQQLVAEIEGGKSS